MIDHLLFFLSTLSLVTRCRPYDIYLDDNCYPNTEILDLNTLLNPDRGQANMKFTLSKIYKASEYFEIRNDKIFTKSTINIDRMCVTIQECCNKDLDYCDFKINIIYSSNSNSMTNIRDILIHIKDVNDHAPQFDETAVEIHISESKRDPYYAVLPLASDVDFGKNRIMDYQISSKEPLSFDDYFELTVTRDPMVPTQVALRLHRNLDRETISQYSFQLLAIDGGTPIKKTGSINVKITITDENDNGPVFQKQLYRAVLKEGYQSTDPILVLSATDIDEGENARIIYDLAPRFIGNVAITENFEIQSNGKIFLKKPLDFEKKTSYRFSVTASNPIPFSNNTLAQSTASVEIDVENVDDEPLHIIVDYDGGKNWSSVMENSPGVFIGYITTQSKEFGRTISTVSCALEKYGNIFELNSKSSDDLTRKSFEVRTVIGIDREVYPRIETVIVCKESHSSNSKSSEAPFVVIVLDENDNSPKLRIEGRTNVMENEIVGKVIFVVRADDPDEGENGRVSYSLDKSEPISLTYVMIGERDGKVRVNSVIDCEVNGIPLTSFDIIVTGMDHGKPSRNVDLHLRINVTDVNDNSPVIKTQPLQFNILENSPPFTAVGEIEVEDRDHSDVVTLKLISSHNILPFTITTKDNKLFFLNSTRSIDRETDAMFKFQIVASDGSSKSAHSVPETVEVKVLDLNDNAPTIIFPTQNNASVHRISVSEPINTRLILVSANDQDQLPDNGRLEYSIEDDLKLFGINYEDKYITTQRSMTKEDLGEHRIEIIVRDCGVPSLESRVAITIVVDQSKPKTVPFEQNLKSNSAGVDKSFGGSNSDIIVYVTITVILFVIIIVTVFFVYFFHRCKKEDNGLYKALSVCCQSLHSSGYTTKSNVASKFSKSSPQDGNQTYNAQQRPLINDQFDNTCVAEHWSPDSSRVPSYNIVTNPYMSAANPYAKLATGPTSYYPLQLTHHYHTIEEARLGQGHPDFSVIRTPSYLLRSKNGEQYKSELNLKRWNDVVSPDNSSPMHWVTSQTPLPIRSRKMTSTAANSDLDNDNFAVAFPVEQSTFV